MQARFPGLAALGIRLLILGAVSAAAFAVAHRFGDAAPLGLPLPHVPQVVQVEGVEVADTSVLEGRIARPWLDELAPQPDGIPPLSYPYSSPQLFTISYPFGAENTIFSQEQFVKNRLESQVNFKLGYPLQSIRCSIPTRREGESITEYAARLRHDLEASGARFYNHHERLELPQYRFEHFEYQLETEGGVDGDLSHYLYIGPLGTYVLAFDFQTVPEHHEAARPLVDKIMNSFAPLAVALEGMRLEDPGYGNTVDDEG